MIGKIIFLIVIYLSTIEAARAQSNRTITQASCPLIINKVQNSIVSEKKDRPKELGLPDSKNTIQTSNNTLNKTQLLQAEYKNLDTDISLNTFQNSITKNNTVEKKVALVGISIPSLWWAKEQFDPFSGRLIEGWTTYPSIKQIDLTVNWQLWTLLDYLGRYRFINQLGTVVREYGYDLRVFNQQQQCLALYKYNETSNPPKWEIQIEGVGQDSLQIQPTNE